MNKIMGFLAGALCGAVVGAVSALLLAPMPGRELQTRTHKQWDDLLLDAQKAAADKRAELEKQLAALKAPHPPETTSA
jgi:gas vesicle protein